MRLITVLCAVSMLAAVRVSWAQEHAACYDLVQDAALRDSEQLRDIAASCDDQSVRDLYYNRALHSDLVSEAIVLERLIEFRSSSGSDSLLSYRMYIAMIEALAPIWFPRLEERVVFLNAQYERRSEIARLRLRGYDPLADRLERQSGALPLPVTVD